MSISEMLKAELEREVSPTSLCYVVWISLNIRLIFFRENNNKQLIVQETCSLVSSKKSNEYSFQFSLFSFKAEVKLTLKLLNQLLNQVSEHAC